MGQPKSRFLFFVNGSQAPRDLPSFPTRRSSDLARDVSSTMPLPFAATEATARRPADEIRPRSEEHTSELQSLRHLVCRLLLEKKKLLRIHAPLRMPKRINGTLQTERVFRRRVSC